MAERHYPSFSDANKCACGLPRGHDRAAPPDRVLLRHLVDVVWGEANEDQSVPSTSWANRMIDHAISGNKGPVPKRAKPSTANNSN